MTIFRDIGKFLNTMASLPSEWPRRLRRIFVLTLPISAPLWGLWYVVVTLTLAILVIVLFPLAILEEWVEKLWKAP
jgi:hypothetical protein